MFVSGPFWFGVVVGYITYRALRRKGASGISDIAAVIGVIGGAAVLKLFPVGSSYFDQYSFGLAAGFFIYLLISLILAKLGAAGAAVNEFLGD